MLKTNIVNCWIELNIVFSVRCLYTKHGNNKQEAYAIAFIDVDLGKNKFLAIEFFDPLKKRGFFFEDLISRIREEKFFGEHTISRMRRQFTKYLKISR